MNVRIQQIIADLNTNPDVTLDWNGPAQDATINSVEGKLGLKFPLSYREFLNIYGGGGELSFSSIAGIWRDLPDHESIGDVGWLTKYATNKHGLPSGLAVINYQDDGETCICLDTTRMNSVNECPVVFFDIFKKKIAKRMAENFDEYFIGYLEAIRDDS